MADAIELDMLIRYIGEPKARELAQLAARPTSLTGITHEAFEELAKAVKGFPGIYGAPSTAREALEALIVRYSE